MDIFFKEHRQLLRLLVKHNVSFILIGGYAVNYYGYERTTGDMDIWLELGNENKYRVMHALRDFGIEDSDLGQLVRIDFESAPPVFFIGEPPRRVDFLTVINNVKFEDAIAEANYLGIEDFQIPVINLKHLILSKITSSRLKDQADVEELQRINRYRNQDN